MAFSTILRWAIALFFTSSVFDIAGVGATNCYYPNGDVSTEGDTPCSGNEGVCCPLNWQCLSNGLCYNPTADFYGRYTCTDQTWQSPDCPQICTYNNTAIGNEAVLWCPSGDWCCDKNRISGNCCNSLFAGTEYFKLADPKQVAFISTTYPVTKYKTVTNSPATFTDGVFVTSAQPGTTPTSSPQTTTSPNSAHTTPSPTTFTHKTLTTGKDGSVETVTQVITKLPPGTALDVQQGHSSQTSNLGMVVGVALGVPLMLIIAGILIFYLCRRRRAQKARHYANLSPAQSKSPLIEANYQNLAPGSHAPELEGFPVAPTRSKSGRKSELFGSDSYANSPTTSRNSIGSGTLPQYSPAGEKRMSMVQINEEPAELWGGYVPYQPARSEGSAESAAEGSDHREFESTAEQESNHARSEEEEQKQRNGS